MRRVKEGTSVVLLQSGLGNVWWADATECYCYLRNIQDLLSDGKTPCERRFGMSFNRPVIPFWSNGRISPYLCERPFDTTSVWFKSLARYIPGLWVARGWNLERRHCIRRHWRIGGDRRIWTPRQKAQCKGSVNADEGWQFLYLRSQMEQSKSLEEISVWEHRP